LKGLLQADAAAAHTADLEIGFELVGAAAVRGIPPLGALLAAAVGADEFECQVADVTAAFLLDRECGVVGLSRAQARPGHWHSWPSRPGRTPVPARQVCQALSTFTISFTPHGISNRPDRQSACRAVIGNAIRRRRRDRWVGRRHDRRAHRGVGCHQHEQECVKPYSITPSRRRSLLRGVTADRQGSVVRWVLRQSAPLRRISWERPSSTRITFRPHFAPYNNRHPTVEKSIVSIE
jgi:hypothetical protein